MNILVVVRHPVGGIRTYIKYVYKEIMARGYICTFAIVEGPEVQYLKEDLTAHGARWVLLKDNKSLLSYAKRIYSELRGSNYHLVHAHGFTSGILGLYGAKLTRTPIIMTSHDVLLPDQFVGAKGWLKKLVMTLLFNRLTLIQSVSNDAQKNLHQMLPFIDNSKSIVIMNGVDEERFLSAEAFNFHQELNIPEETLLLAFFGRFMGQKGFRYIVDAVEILKYDESFTKPLLVVTVGNGGFFREEVADIKNRGLEAHFRHLPYASNIAEMTKSIHAVVIPSLWEACPLLPMEAMIAGTPIMATDCLGLKEVTKNTPAINIKMKDGESIAKAIKELNEESRVTSRCFADSAAARFSIKATIDGVEQMYKDLA